MEAGRPALAWMSAHGPELLALVAEEPSLHSDTVSAIRVPEGLDAREVEISADAGVVTLEGEVPGASDAVHAEMLVRATPGVTAVRNLLRHDPGPRAVDKLAPQEPPHLQGRWGRWVPPFIT